jgi:hypothetical protein
LTAVRGTSGRLTVNLEAIGPDLLEIRWNQVDLELRVRDQPALCDPCSKSMATSKKTITERQFQALVSKHLPENESCSVQQRQHLGGLLKFYDRGAA